MSARTSRSSEVPKPSAQPVCPYPDDWAPTNTTIIVDDNWLDYSGHSARGAEFVKAQVRSAVESLYKFKLSPGDFESRSHLVFAVSQPALEFESYPLPSAVAHLQPKPSPALFSMEWHGALGQFLGKANSAELNGAILRLMQTFGQLAPLRPPHIELIDGEEICFTWNKNNKYLDVTAFKDGHLEWYFRDSTDESKPSTQGEGPTLSDAAIKLIEQYARP